MSSKKTPIFPIPEALHFSDYGFDPQIDYFQVLEEARRHKINGEASTKSVDAMHFKLQKPISKESCTSKKNTTKKWWWRNPLLFFRRKWAAIQYRSDDIQENGMVVHRGSAPRGSISGPVYITESRTGSSTPCRTSTRKPYSGPFAGSVTPAVNGEVEFPYTSLRELNMDHQRISTSALPIYLVT